LAEWELQDGLKTGRVAVANAEAAAEAREFAALYRAGKIANASYQLEVLGGELVTIREEKARLQAIMDGESVQDNTNSTW